jgi:hypothetical protein
MRLRATKNPDHLSAVFTAFLCISPLTSSGFFIGLNIWIAAMIGTFIGTAVSAAAYIDPDDPDFFWWLVFKTPIGAHSFLHLYLHTLLCLLRWKRC